MWRVQTPTFYFENLAEICDASVLGGMFLGINDAELINRYDMSRVHVRYLKNQHPSSVLGE